MRFAEDRNPRRLNATNECPMSDDFEPRLGRSSRETAQPATQLQRLAAQRLKRHPRTFGCKKFAPGEIRWKGRGKGAAAVAQHWSHVSNRRVFVRSSAAPARGSNTSAFSSYTRYLLRYPTDEDTNRGRLYSRDSDTVEVSDFNRRSRHDPRQFRFVIAPEDSHQIQDMSAFTRRLMLQVERDLGTQVDWVAVNHFNTANPHTHIAVRGRSPTDQELIINRRYMIAGIRHRAEEIVTNMLGPKTFREISAAKRLELYQERLTSIDQYISQSQTRETVRVSRNAARRAAPGLTAQVKRLQYLEKLGLAEHVYGPQWRLRPGWTDALRTLGQRTETLLEVGRAVGDDRSAMRLEEVKPTQEGKWVTGRLVAVSGSDTSPLGHLLVIDGLDGRIWLAQAAGEDTLQLPRLGGVISALIEPNPAAPISARSKRPESHDTPPDGHTIRTFVNSWLPVNQLIDRQAFTWLDEISDDQVSAYSSGFGAEVRAAKSARQAFLAASSLDLSDIDALRRSELARAAKVLADRTGKRYAELQSREVFRGEYTEQVDTAYGRFAVIANETRFTFTPMTNEVASLKGKTVMVEQGPLSAGNLLWRSRGIER